MNKVWSELGIGHYIAIATFKQESQNYILLTLIQSNNKNIFIYKYSKKAWSKGEVKANCLRL